MGRAVTPCPTPTFRTYVGCSAFVISTQRGFTAAIWCCSQKNSRNLAAERHRRLECGARQSGAGRVDPDQTGWMVGASPFRPRAIGIAPCV